ncbi:hypothetical protein CN286_03445 [Bacillus anthracis]|nr:hypothetical protein CN286_03445 [Bacillus anthracis]
MREVLRHEELAVGTGYILKAEVARSKSQGIGALDLEALCFERESEMTGDSSRYQLKSEPTHPIRIN